MEDFSIWRMGLGICIDRSIIEENLLDFSGFDVTKEMFAPYNRYKDDSCLDVIPELGRREAMMCLADASGEVSIKRLENKMTEKDRIGIVRSERRMSGADRFRVDCMCMAPYFCQLYDYPYDAFRSVCTPDNHVMFFCTRTFPLSEHDEKAPGAAGGRK